MNYQASQFKVAIANHGSAGGVYYPAFDYLRFILALTVVAFHANLLGWDHAGDLAVQVFFALSGWLIGGILIRSRPTQFARFYFNRAARIWVPYFAALAILVTASLLRDPVITKKWYEFVFYMLTFVYNLAGVTQLAADQGPLTGTGSYIWSVCAEEQFYLVAPLLLVVLPFGQSLLVWVGIAIALLASPFSAMFAAITLGVLAALTQKRFAEWHRGSVAMAAVGALSLLTLALTFFDILKYQKAAPFIGVMVVLLFAWRGEAPSSRVAVFLGGVSYPLYLNHWLGLRGVRLVSDTFHIELGFGSKMAGMLAAIAVSSLLYFLIDVQVAKRRDQWFSSTRGVALALIGVSLVVTGLIGGLLFQAPWKPLVY
jgi:peptidoglycan/LPS O-acetylase OafA/YrhL